MTLPVFLHIESTPNPEQMEALQGYLSQVPAIIQRFGGVPVATYDVEQVLDDGPRPSVFVVVSFPSREHIQRFFDDEEYARIVPLREKGFRHLRFYITSERI